MHLLISLIIIFAVAASTASGGPNKTPTLTNDYFLIDASTPFYKRIQGVANKLWPGVKKVYLQDRGQDLSVDEIQSIERLPCPPLKVFDSSAISASYEPVFVKGSADSKIPKVMRGAGPINIHTGMMEWLEFQEERIASVLAHEMVHALQSGEELYVKSPETQTLVGPKSEVFQRMTSESGANALSLQALIEVDMNPFAAVEVAQLLTAFDSPKNINTSIKSKVEQTLRAVDAHRYPYREAKAAEEELRRRGIPLQPTDLSNTVSPQLSRRPELQADQKEALQEVHDLLDSYPSGEGLETIFRDHGKDFGQATLVARLVDVYFMHSRFDEPDSDSVESVESAALTISETMYVFPVVERIMGSHIKTQNDLAVVVELVHKFFQAVFEDQPQEVDDYLYNFVYNLWFSADYQPGLDSFGNASLLDRETKTLSFGQALSKYFQSLFLKSFDLWLAAEPSREIHDFLDPEGPLDDLKLRTALDEKYKEDFVAVIPIELFSTFSSSLFLRDLVYSQYLNHQVTNSSTTKAKALEVAKQITFLRAFAETDNPADSHHLSSLARYRYAKMRRSTSTFETIRKISRLAPEGSQSQKDLVQASVTALAPELLDQSSLSVLQLSQAIRALLSDKIEDNLGSLDPLVINVENLRDRVYGISMDTLKQGPQVYFKEIEKSLGESISLASEVSAIQTLAASIEFLHNRLHRPLTRRDVDAAYLFAYGLSVDQLEVNLSPFASKLISSQDYQNPKMHWDSSSSQITSEATFDLGLATDPTQDKNSTSYGETLLIARGAQLASSFEISRALRQLKIMEAMLRGENLEVEEMESYISGLDDASSEIRVIHAGNSRSADGYIYPVPDASYEFEDMWHVINAMSLKMLDLMGGVFQGSIAELEFVDKIHEETSRLFLLQALHKKIQHSSLEDAAGLLEIFLPEWEKFEGALDSSAGWGLFRNSPRVFENLFFKKDVESIHETLIQKMATAEFTNLSVNQKLDFFYRVTNLGNGSLAMDKEILEFILTQNPESLAALSPFSANHFGELKENMEGWLSAMEVDRSKNREKPMLAEILRRGMFHPLRQSKAIAHVMRGFKNDKDRARFAASASGSSIKYRSVWTDYLDPEEGRSIPIDRKLLKIIDRYEPEDGRARLSSEEFTQRVFHQVDTIIANFSDEETTAFCLFLAQPNHFPLSTEVRSKVRNHLTVFFGSHAEVAIESSTQRLFADLDIEKQRFFLAKILIAHPTAIYSRSFEQSLADTPLFAKESHPALDKLKEVVWNNLSTADASGLAAMVMTSQTIEGAFFDNDDLVVESLELLGTMGRKLAQILTAHGNFIRPSLRERFKVFRDDNKRSSRLELIAELEKIFEEDLGISFWDHVVVVDEVLGAGSLKTALRARLKGGNEEVLKIIDPIAKQSLTRMLRLASKSLEEWTSEQDEELSGIIAYIFKQLDHAVNAEVDLELEAKNTVLHESKRLARPQGNQNSTPLCLNERLCSARLHTLSYIPSRGNANSETPTADESLAIAQEILDQFFTDEFLHGDLQNAANILLLLDRKPAFIDLSLSRPLSKQEALLIVKFAMTLADEAMWREEPQTQLSRIFEFLQEITQSVRDVQLSSDEHYSHLDEALTNVLREFIKKKNIDIFVLLSSLEAEQLVVKDQYIFMLEALGIAFSYYRSAMAGEETGDVLTSFGSEIEKRLGSSETAVLEAEDLSSFKSSCFDTYSL